MKMPQKNSLPCSKEEFDFATAESLGKAAEIVLGSLQHKRMYQHYCRLDKALCKIIQKRWYLTKFNSSKLNDLREPMKFAANASSLKCTYIACFGHCLAESAAMWGLYGKGDPLALRITIPGDVLETWMRSIEIRMMPKSDAAQKKKVYKSMCIKGLDNMSIPNGKFQSSVFRDVLYASVADSEKLDEYDIKRGNRVLWRRAFYNLKKDDCALDGLYAGFMKDSSWSYEMESRLCINLKKEIDSECISIVIPDEVIASMRFTFSPWLDRSLEKYLRKILETALVGAGVDLGGYKGQRFRRSVLQGALNF